MEKLSKELTRNDTLNLHDYLNYFISSLYGKFVRRPKGYEKDFAYYIYAKYVTPTKKNEIPMYDATLFLEQSGNTYGVILKKCAQKVWVDLRVLSRFILMKNRPEIPVIIFITEKGGDRIVKIHAIKMSRLVQHFNLNERRANTIMKINADYPKGFRTEVAFSVEESRRMSCIDEIQFTEKDMLRYPSDVGSDVGNLTEPDSDTENNPRRVFS